MSIQQNAPFYLINILIHSAVYVSFILYSVKSRLRYRPRKTVPAALGYVILLAVAALLFFEREAPLGAYGVPALIGLFAVSIVACILLIRDNPIQLTFLLLMTFSIQNNMTSLARTISDLEQFPCLQGFEYGSYLLLTEFILFAYLPVMWYLYIKLFKRIMDTGVDFAYWKYLWVLPGSFLILLHVSPLSSLADFFAPEKYGVRDVLQALLLNVAAILSYAVSLNMLLKTYDNLKALECTNLMERQLEMQKDEYKRLMKSIKENARQRHDWRHHLLTIGGLAQNKKFDALEAYLESYIAGHMADEGVPVCGNVVVDIILRHFISRAREQGVEVEVEADIPGELRVSDLDLCVIFGNLVENAVEACSLMDSGNRFIRIWAEKVGSQLFFTVQNSYMAEPKRCGKDFLSSKREGKGIGISSVKNIVESGGGVFAEDSENGVFTVKVLLNI